MKKTYELKPTKENLLDTYINDSIGRNEKINKFINLLNGINDNCSIAKNGKWGSGKTFFVKQVKNIVNSVSGVDTSEIDNKFKEEYLKTNTLPTIKQRAIYYDAWEHDDEEDPIYSIILSIVKETNIDFVNDDTNILVNLLSTCLNITNNKEIIASFKNLGQNSDLSKVKERVELKKDFSVLLHDVIAEHYGRLVIIIDELDRCCPSFAVKVLERLKHYFGDELITYVFSTNLEELNCTIKTYYGNDFNATEYLNRFFDFIIDIPEIDIKKYLITIHENPNSNYRINEYKQYLIEKYKLSMRETAKFIRMVNIVVGDNLIGKSNDIGNEAQYFVKLYIIPLMIILKFKNINSYNDFVVGKDANPIYDTLLNNDDAWLNKSLLNYNETFGKVYTNSTQNIHIDKKQRLTELYTILFIGIKDGLYEERIGRLLIDNEMKKYVMDIANMLSNISSI